MCVPNETKNINVKAFILITNKDEAKAMTENISCDCKCKSIVKHVIQNKNGIIKHVNVNAKITTKCEKNYCWNPNPCIYKNGKYLKSVANTSVTECDFSINVMSKYVDTLIHWITNYFLNIEFYILFYTYLYQLYFFETKQL